MQLAHVGQRIDRLTDALIDKMIDNDAFNTRKQALMLERRKVEDAIEKMKKRNNSPGHIRKFLELIKSLVSTYIFATKGEKRAIIELMTSNRTVLGRFITVEPSDWLLKVQNALAVLYCAHDPTTSRSSPELMEKQFDELLALADSKEAWMLERFGHCGLDGKEKPMHD